MTRRRWIADEFSDDHAALTGAHAAHLSRTLRARVGQEFEVACGDCVRRATVTSVSDDRVEFTLGEDVAASAVVPITLLLAIFKFDRMEWAIEKCTELGVARIVPVIAQRTDSHLAAAALKRAERWRRIALQAAEQSRRAHPPAQRGLQDHLGAGAVAGEQRPRAEHLGGEPAEHLGEPVERVGMARAILGVPVQREVGKHNPEAVGELVDGGLPLLVGEQRGVKQCKRGSGADLPIGHAGAVGVVIEAKPHGFIVSGGPSPT